MSELTADAKIRVADKIVADASSPNAAQNWARVHTAVCTQLPWQRTADEHRIVTKLCRPSASGVCTACEWKCLTAYPERMVCAAAVVVVLIILLLR